MTDETREQMREREARHASLLREGAGEIRRLRLRVMSLTQYRDQTERLLALFEGGPRGRDMVSDDVDLAWTLERAAETFEPPPTGDGKP